MPSAPSGGTATGKTIPSLVLLMFNLEEVGAEMQLRLTPNATPIAEEEDSDEEVRNVLEGQSELSKALLVTNRLTSKVAAWLTKCSKALQTTDSEPKPLTREESKAACDELLEVKSKLLGLTREARDILLRAESSREAVDNLIDRRKRRRAEERQAIRTALARLPGSGQQRAHLVAVLVPTELTPRPAGASATPSPPMTPPACVTPEPASPRPRAVATVPPSPRLSAGFRPGCPTPRQMRPPRVPRRRVTADATRGARRGGFGRFPAPGQPP